MRPKLIVLRGPAGSGKSTIAAKLHRIADFPNILIEQDYYKEVMFAPREANKQVRTQMIFDNAKLALRHNLSVIMDGIFGEKYRPYFNELFDRHQADNFMFYFDVSFEETLRRHTTRDKAAVFGEEEMRQRYSSSQTSAMGYEFEHRITDDLTLEQTLRYVAQTVGLDLPRVSG